MTIVECAGKCFSFLGEVRKVLDIDFKTTEEGIEKLKRAIKKRDRMGGALYWNACEGDCLKLADRLTAAGVDKNIIASIGGWEIRER